MRFLSRRIVGLTVSVATVVITASIVAGAPASAAGSEPADGYVDFTKMRYFDCTGDQDEKCQMLVTAGEDIRVGVVMTGGATGTLSLVEGATVLASNTIDQFGEVLIDAKAGIAAGAHHLDLQYSGDDQYAPGPLLESFDVEALPAPATGSYQRIAGPNRVATAAAMAADVFRRPDYARAVYLARSDDPNDALCAGAVAGWQHSAVLLTSRDALSPETRDELQRTPKPTEVILVGGTAAISDHVKDEVAALGLSVRRIAGNNRYETCVGVAPTDDIFDVFFVTGTNPYDALSASAAAAAEHGVVLLTDGDTMPAVSQQYWDDNGASAFAIGGPATRAAPDAADIAGNDRYQTSAMVAEKFFPIASFVGIATGKGWADALAGGPHIYLRAHGPLLLVGDHLSPGVDSYLEGQQQAHTTIAAFVYGGTSAVSDATANEVKGRL